MGRVLKNFVLVLAAALAATAATAPSEAQESPGKPNIVFVLTDDMRADDLQYMPKTKSLLVDGGMKFDNAYQPLALCCPSRSTILLGQYAHNHQVWDNNAPDGGYQHFRDLGHESSTIATWLHDAGYATGLFGKYLNGYDAGSGGSVPPTPPGWDRWFAKLGPGESQYYDYDVDDDGASRHYGNATADYWTDVLSEKVGSFIDQHASGAAPFFLYVAPSAPHGPAVPATRDQGQFQSTPLPKPPNFDEADVSDKPPGVANLPRLTDADLKTMKERYQGRLESLQAVDDMMENIVNRLSASGELSNTYVVFTSDNGWEQGEHRIPEGKRRPYEESIHLPLVIRGPGVTAGSNTDKLALNTDFAPTFAGWGGTAAPSSVDGRSLDPVLRGTGTNSWRTAFLLENRVSQNPDKSFFGVRTIEQPRKYVEYQDGFRELYDLASDPYELENSYDSGAPPADLQARVDALKVCAGESCRAAEDADTSVGDTTPPTVTEVTPTANQTSVQRSTNITATFSEEMDPSTLTASTVGLYQEQRVKKRGKKKRWVSRWVPVSAQVSCDDPCQTVTLHPYPSDPSLLLAPYARHSALVTTGAKDKSGNALGRDYSWTFTTGST